jgi:hypothetical protein
MENQKFYNFLWGFAALLLIFSIDAIFVRSNLLGFIFGIFSEILCVGFLKCSDSILSISSFIFSFLGTFLIILPILIGIDSFKGIKKFWLILFICGEILVIIFVIFFIISIAFSGGSSTMGGGEFGIILMPIFFFIVILPYVLLSYFLIFLKRKQNLIGLLLKPTNHIKFHQIRQSKST